MAIGRFTRQIKLAKRLIEKNGEQSVLRRKADGTPPDPTKPWEPGTPTFTDFTVSAVWLDYAIGRIDGALVKVGDQRVLIPAADLTIVPDPTTDQLIRVSGDQWEIIRVEPLQPNEERIFYAVQARQ